jgi:hypothetical protein
LLSQTGYPQKKLKKRNNLKISNYRGSINSFANKRYFAFGGGINILNYFGDLAPKSKWASTDLKFTRPGVSIFVDYKYAPRITFRLVLEMGTLTGDDFVSADPNDDMAKYRYIRNLQFRNRIYELSFQAKFDLFTNRGTYISRPVFNPYIFGGVGLFYHNPKAIAPETDQLGSVIPEAGEWVALQPLGTEGQYSEVYDVKPYSKIQYSVPVGLGFSYKLNNSLDLSFEIGYRVLFFDYIDDVSGNYLDLGIFDNPLARALSDRSQELTAVRSGDPRDFEDVILPNTIDYTYTSEYDGNTYTVYAGYGGETRDNIRGNSGDNDIFLVTSLKITYTLGGTFQNAKFR